VDSDTDGATGVSACGSRFSRPGLLEAVELRVGGVTVEQEYPTGGRVEQLYTTAQRS
jgi:hypothetical protein